ncbi:PE family protein [Mycobacterium bourgelatii]|uniref:PE domain-containing protein n=1 Tax=Mycobacterium bourgelatii TaxID=1273442 RepID=A0A7I9YTM3_MYCBU|nr:PE family protein [Mycobacterium bourgelatii]MCV6978397.1 PE family protein [Mycobacterium bourgelatii]GFG92041.1 hypothetical protein MBOU_40830 [Mycobacterium bourgelatii]
MPSTFIAPEIVAGAASELAEIGAAIGSANASAAAPTTQVLAAAADEVSTAIAALFSTNAQQFQSLANQALNFHDGFVKLLNNSAAQYLSTELTNAQQTLANTLNAPIQNLLGQLAIGSASTLPNPAASGTSGPVLWETPFGPIKAWTTVDYADVLPGAMTMTLTLETAVGTVVWSNSGLLSPPSSQMTGGTITLPPALPLLAAMAGPYVTGQASLANSNNAFFAAIANGDFVGATSAFVSAPFEFTNSILFGHHTVEIGSSQLPAILNTGGVGGQDAFTLKIPFGGLMAGAQPISVTYYDQPGTFVGSTYSYQGTQLGGLGYEIARATGGLALLQAIGAI